MGYALAVSEVRIRGAAPDSQLLLLAASPLDEFSQRCAYFCYENTLRQAGLSFALLFFRQARMRLSFGIAAAQSRKTSGEQARCTASAVGAKIRVMKVSPVR
jgi:hypothetical protein